MTENIHKAAALLPAPLGSSGDGSPAGRQDAGLVESGTCQGSCLMTCFPSPAAVREIPSPPQTVPLRVLWYLGMETSWMEAIGQNTTTRLGDQETLQSSSCPLGPSVFGKSELLEVSLDLETEVPSTGDQSLQVRGGLLCRYILPSSLRTTQSHLGLKTAQASGMRKRQVHLFLDALGLGEL